MFNPDPAKVYIVGAGPGAVDLITLRGHELLKRADLVVYAGSLVNPELPNVAKSGCEIHDSASLTLEQVVDLLAGAARKGRLAVRLHTGDPSLYGAIREQIDALRALGIECEVVPGVSSFAAAAAALSAEYTLPGVSQSLILTRAPGRTPVPEGESLKSFAVHRASVVLFLSSGMIERACLDLTEGGYPPDTLAALVYRASWDDQKIVRGTLATLSEAARREGIDKTALILVGDFLGDRYERSKLYDPAFSHGFRSAAAAAEERAETPKAALPGRIALVAFTKDGVRTALRLQRDLGGRVYAPPRFVGGDDVLSRLDLPVSKWAAAHFGDAEALVFVCAVGIAVRAIAPLAESKTSDPAVVCLDDLGRNVVPLLSGHLGGANDLAVKIASVMGGNAVVTTSTDLHGITAPDTWARRTGLTVENPREIRAVSGALIDGREIGVAVTEETIPPPWPITLRLRPKNLVLGVGCRKGIAPSALEEAIADFLDGAGVSPHSIAAIASIDLKKDEAAIVAWCGSRDIPFLTWMASELEAIDGPFASSERVRRAVGVDNVCERSAVIAARKLSGSEVENGGVLMRSKTLYEGITLALARIRSKESGR